MKLLKEPYIFIKENRLISVLILIGFLSTLRTLFLPLLGDEVTYSIIARNIMLHGEYSYYDQPTTITPTIPFLISFFYTKFDPMLGINLARFSNMLFIIVGLRYLYLFLKNTDFKKQIIVIIMLLTLVNSNFVIWSLMLYPESILFCFLWIFIYYLSKKDLNARDIFFLFGSLCILIITRYVFAVLILLAVIKIFPYFKILIKKKDFLTLGKISTYIFICTIPLILWFKYVYNLEREIESGFSYFGRFKDKDIFYNIKAGIGLIKHQEVSNINGIPAFITLFLPITAFRSWILSFALLLPIIIGYLTNINKHYFRSLGLVIILLMGGLIFAGTGFSRYWLPLLPGFLVGFYLFFNTLNLKDSHFVILSKIVAVIYVINELRLDVKILNNYW